MEEGGINIFDFLALVAVSVAGYSGYHLGFAECIWMMLRWALILAVGTLCWSPLGHEICTHTGWSLTTGGILAYLSTAVLIWVVIDLLQSRLGARVLLAIPAGPVDGVFGAVAGVTAVGSAALVILAILSPLDVGPIDWNPMAMENRDSIGEFGKAIFGTVRQAAFGDSLLGRTLQEHLRVLLIQPSAA